MIDKEIEDYLSTQRLSFDESVRESIEEKLKEAQEESNEEKANYYWLLRAIFDLQKAYVNAYSLLTQKKYEDAWNTLDRVDQMMGCIDTNFPNRINSTKFNLLFISQIVKEYQRLFPYRDFLSREAVLRESKCSICGQIYKLRHHCCHEPGKVYMGQLCVREITKADLKAIVIVTDPFDKYAMIKIEGKEYNYGMIDDLLKTIDSPYRGFSVETKKVKKAEYEKVGRNDLCPCGSGMKYKKCHLGKPDELMNHFVVHLQGDSKPAFIGVRDYNTWI